MVRLSSTPIVSNRSEDGRHLSGSTGGRHALVVLASSVLVALLLVGLHVRAYPKISPLDELSHIDMLEKASRFELVRLSDRVGQTAMREEACRGLDREDVIPRCDQERFDPQYFQEYGENSVARKFPVYYFLTGLAARAVRWLTPIDSIVTAARLLNALWLAAGLLLCWLLMRELALPPPARVVALAWMATTPVVLHASATVNSDATLLASGAAIAWATLRFERRALGGSALGFLLLAAVVVEQSNLVAVLLSVTFLGLRAVGRVFGSSGRTSREGARLMAASLIVGLAALASVPVLHAVQERLVGHSRIPVDPPTPAAQAVQHRAVEVQSGAVPASRILGEVSALVTPVRNPYVPAVLAGVGTTMAITLLDWLLLGAVVAGALGSTGGSRVEALAVAAIVAMVVPGPLHALANAARDVFFVTPARFGLSLLPTLGALLSTCLGKRWALVAVGALAALAALNAVAHLAVA